MPNDKHALGIPASGADLEAFLTEVAKYGDGDNRTSNVAFLVMEFARPSVVRCSQAFDRWYAPAIKRALTWVEPDTPPPPVLAFATAAFAEGWDAAARRIAQLLDVNGDTLNAALDELCDRGIDQLGALHIERLRTLPAPDLDRTYDDAFYACLDAALDLPAKELP